jgi:hypothetical protein
VLLGPEGVEQKHARPPPGGSYPRRIVVKNATLLFDAVLACSTEQALAELPAAMWLGGLIACCACASGMELFAIGSESGARPEQEASGWIEGPGSGHSLVASGDC